MNLPPAIREIFDLVRQVVWPTPEERAAEARANTIARLESDLIITLQGGVTYKPVSIKDFDVRQLPSERSLGYFYMMEEYMPQHVGEMPQSLEDIKNELLSLGVSQMHIDGLVTRTYAHMRDNERGL